MKARILIALLVLISGANFALGQTTAFSYQGRLIDGSLPANASYDFTFRLFDVDAGGTSLAGQIVSGVSVSNGVFTVELDLGDNFDGGSRWLEIAVRPAGPGAYTTLNPRQPVSSAPYSVRSLISANADNATTATNSLQLGGVAANQYVITTDTRLSDERNPLPGSQNYIRNSGVVQDGDFNVSGDGVADVFSARAEYQINGQRILGVTGSASTFAGLGAGASSTGEGNSFFGRNSGGGPANSGNVNSFFGERSGASNTTGVGNSFFGSAAGVSNTSGTANSFFGLSAGQSNTNGVDNSFFGAQAGLANTTGRNNAFFGRGAGAVNTTNNNSFFGSFSGDANTIGEHNAFFGFNAGTTNVTANDNSFFGYEAGRQSTGGSNSFFGSLAGTLNITGRYNAFFGTSSGADNTTGERNTFIGFLSGRSNTTGDENTFIGSNAGQLNVTGTGNVFIGRSAGGEADGSNNIAIGSNANIVGTVFDPNPTFATAIGAGAFVDASNTIVLGRTQDIVRVPGRLLVSTLGVSGSTALCLGASNLLANCSSSLRYKTNVNTFFSGLDIVRRLRPITFNWKDGGTHDVGFAAEEVAMLEPLLATYNDKGDIEGVKYAQITTVLINAVNEQQSQIEKQQQIIDRQQRQIDELNKQQLVTDKLNQIVCSLKPDAAACKEIK